MIPLLFGVLYGLTLMPRSAIHLIRYNTYHQNTNSGRAVGLIALYLLSMVCPDGFVGIEDWF